MKSHIATDSITKKIFKQSENELDINSLEKFSSSSVSDLLSALLQKV
ncbi:MAG: hypothetical protein JXR95_00670 [Deltaproteobacteria bacterium]|nr:hypothetical protein [Deltaproteobacteria bacterium]